MVNGNALLCQGTSAMVIGKQQHVRPVYKIGILLWEVRDDRRHGCVESKQDKKQKIRDNRIWRIREWVK